MFPHIDTQTPSTYMYMIRVFIIDAHMCSTHMWMPTHIHTCTHRCIFALANHTMTEHRHPHADMCTHPTHTCTPTHAYFHTCLPHTYRFTLAQNTHIHIHIHSHVHIHTHSHSPTTHTHPHIHAHVWQPSVQCRYLSQGALRSGCPLDRPTPRSAPRLPVPAQTHRHTCMCHTPTA